MSELPLPNQDGLTATWQPRSSPEMAKRSQNGMFRRARGSVKVKSEAEQESSSNHGSPKSIRRRCTWMERFGLQKPHLPPPSHKCQPANVPSPTEDEEELKQTDTLPDEPLLKTDDPLQLMDNGLRSDPSSTSVESGYSTNASQSSLLSTGTTKSHVSTLRIIGETECSNVGESKSRSSGPTSEKVLSDVQTPTGTASGYEIQHPESSPVNKRKDVHPNCLFSINPSENDLCTSETAPDFPPDSPSDESVLRQEVPSPAESNASSVSQALNPFSSMGGPQNRRGSTKTRIPYSVGTKFYKVTPRKYLKKSRATSALHLVC